MCVCGYDRASVCVCVVELEQVYAIPSDPVSRVGCSEEAYKLKIELLETGGIHNRRTKIHLQGA